MPPDTTAVVVVVVFESESMVAPVAAQAEDEMASAGELALSKSDQLIVNGATLFAAFVSLNVVIYC